MFYAYTFHLQDAQTGELVLVQEITTDSPIPYLGEGRKISLGKEQDSLTPYIIETVSLTAIASIEDSVGILVLVRESGEHTPKENLEESLTFAGRPK